MSNEKAKVTAEERTRELFSLWEAHHWPIFCKRMCEIVKEAESAARAEGFADAQERAAKVADSQMPGNYPIDPISGCKGRIAELILALKPQ